MGALRVTCGSRGEFQTLDESTSNPPGDAAFGVPKSCEGPSVGDFLYCLNTSTIRPTPLLEKIRIAGASGYNAIEPWNDEIDDYLRSGGTLGDLREAIDDEGLKVASVIALFGWTDDRAVDYAAVLDECRRRMDQAAATGEPLHRRQPPAGGRRSRRSPGGVTRNCCALGREIGVRPAMEFLGFVEGVNTSTRAGAIAAGLGGPRGDDRRRRLPHDAGRRLGR